MTKFDLASVAPHNHVSLVGIAVVAHGWAAADQISVTVGVVNSSDGGPEL